MISPRHGLALVRPVKTQETVPGGLLWLTHNTREFLTAGQAEIVAVGKMSPLEPDEEPEADVYEMEDLHPGTWVLLRHRTWIETDQDDLFLVRHQDIMARLE